MITSLFDLDRKVREAAGRLAAARRALVARTSWEELPSNPLAPLRELLSKATLRDLGEVPDTLLAPALGAHLARLTLARVLWDDEVRVARAWSEATVQVEGVKLPRLPKGLSPGADALVVSPRTLLAAVMVDADDARRGRVGEALARGARERLRDPVRSQAERRVAASIQLGVSLDAIDLPAPLAAIEGAALELVGATQAFAERFAPWDQGLARAAAHDAVKGWPAHLQPRWILSVFAGTELARGAPVEGIRLPFALGGMSFARGLAIFGEAFGASAGPSSVPFALAHPVGDLRAARIGALFGSLASEPAFARRVLELGPGAARDHARTFARSSTAHVRLAAAAVRTRSALLPPRDDLDDRFCEETARAWGEPLPPAFAGVLPRITAATPVRFAASLVAALDRARMIEMFDEDWFRNPRSIEALRAIASDPQEAVTEELLRKGAVELGRTLAEHAG